MLDNLVFVLAGMGIALVLIFLTIILSRGNGSGNSRSLGVLIDLLSGRRTRRKVTRRRGKIRDKRQTSEIVTKDAENGKE